MIFFETANAKQRVVKYPSVLEECLPRDISLTWKNVCCIVEKKRNGDSLRALLRSRRNDSITLLNGVNGVASSGTLMAILGPSGAGKTTLLAAISKRVKGKVTGQILLNGEPVDTGQMIKVSGFVPQKDLVVDSLTVQEHMEFMARMKMDRRVRERVRKQRILVLMAELGLSKCTGSRLSSLSGGERKRVALAVQLLTEPRILFCDEPTTGLDSYAAMAVAKTLRDVAATGRIVVCSVHQPASGLLDVFHEVLLLSGGRVAFQGTSIDAIRFFDSLELHCPISYNSAEFYVSQLSIVRGKETDSYRKINWICDQFAGSKFGRKVTARIESTGSSRAFPMPDDTVPAAFLEAEARPSHDLERVRAFTQIYWLTWRTYVDYKRNSASHLLRLTTYMLIGLLISSPYMTVLTETVNQGGIQNVQGLMYLVVVETVFTFNYAVFYTFPRELPLLLRDIAAGLYAPAAYYISKVAVLIPGTIIQPVLFTLLIFTVTGLSGGLSGFFYFTLPVVLCAVSASAVGCFLSAAFKSVDTASLISVPLDFLGLIFCGIYLHLGHLGAGIAWLKYTSQFYYGLEAVSLTQWLQVDHINCSEDPEEPCISSGLGVLEKYGYQPDHYMVDLIGLLAIFVLGHFAGFLVIRYRSRREPVY